MNARRPIVALTFVLFTLAAWAWGAPATITIQGKLADAAGRPLPGTRTWRVKFYNDPAGGTQLGATLAGTAAVAATGRFAIEVTPPAAVLAAAGNVYYELGLDSAATPDGAVGPSDVFGTRVKVTSVLLAQRANAATTATNALQLGGVAPAGYATATALTNGLAAKASLTHTHQLQNLGGAVTDAQVPDTVTILHAAEADEADHADLATSATHADRATTATTAEWALGADYASTSGLANVAFLGLEAMYAWDADYAVTSTYADLATTATYADLATTATYALNAGRLGDVVATDYATQAWVAAQNFATQSWVAIQNFATQNWVMSWNFATQSWVNAQGFATQSWVAIQNFATQSWVNANVMTIVRASDGAGSLLDADLLDGQQGAFYQNAANINAGTLGTNFYSAYTDLAAESRIDGGMPTNLLSQNGGDGRYWRLGGNAGTTPPTQYVGTTDNQALEMSVNGARALRLEPGSTPNVIGGYVGNSASWGVVGASIGGGGAAGSGNFVYDNFGTVAGGFGNRAGTVPNTPDQPYAAVGGGLTNQAGGIYATIPGGVDNTAGGTCSFAAGYLAHADHNGAFVWSSWNSGVTSSERNDQFRVNAVGGVKLSVNGNRWINFYNDTVNLILADSGARLTLGGIWTNASDRNSKENFKSVDTQAVLDNLLATSITTWNYKAENPATRHMGPVAQDFKAAFGLGDSDKSIGTLDADGVALAAIQALGRRNRELEAQNQALEARLAALEKLVAGMK